jgi:uncharacterized Ntn-hydrolase superfamily protein
MTYSLAGRCARTGMLGTIVTTSSIAVGNRCQFARAGVGAVLTQHRTDPRLGPLGLSFLNLGLTAEETINALVSSTPHDGWRQLAAIDADGRSAHFSGHNIVSIHAGASGRDCVAIANVVRSAQVPAAMVHAFEAAPHKPLAERLCAALQAGNAAGGEFKKVTSAGLLVVHEHAFPYVDLRVDDHPDPIADCQTVDALRTGRRQLPKACARAGQPRGKCPLGGLSDRRGGKGGAGQGGGRTLTAGCPLS